jgi:hypothetical protein
VPAVHPLEPFIEIHEMGDKISDGELTTHELGPWQFLEGLKKKTKKDMLPSNSLSLGP